MVITIQWNPATESRDTSDTKPKNETHTNLFLQKEFTLQIQMGTEMTVQLQKKILTWIDNDIYSTVDACPNACEMWKAIERWMHVQRRKEIDKLLALISLSFKKIYKPTNNNLRTSSNTNRANQDNTPRINRGTGYDNQRVVNVAGARENVDSYSDAVTFIGPIFDVESLQKLQFLDTVKFGNDQIAPILGYGYLVQGNVTIKRVYYIEVLNHNLLSVGFRGSDLYSITLQDTTSPNPICLMAKATSSQAWLWHPIATTCFTQNHSLYSTVDACPNACEMWKAIERGLHAQVRTVRTHKGTKFLIKTLHLYFAQEGIEHQMSTARTPEQNSVVEIQNRTLVEAARTMLSASKVPLFFWAEVIATTWYSTQSRAYRVYNKKTRVIVETIHVNFDELPQMASDRVSSDSVPQYFLFSPMFDELLNGTTQVVSKSSAVNAVDVPDKCQQQNKTQSTTTTVVADIHPLNIQATPESTNSSTNCHCY
ncbi:integrase, catalytic region, zinc finger, CCHC-type containing protein [Tanacetum coccineum]